jgi:hypothetical protein
VAADFFVAGLLTAQNLDGVAIIFLLCGGGEDPWLCGPGFGRVCLMS